MAGNSSKKIPTNSENFYSQQPKLHKNVQQNEVKSHEDDIRCDVDILLGEPSR